MKFQRIGHVTNGSEADAVIYMRDLGTNLRHNDLLRDADTQQVYLVALDRETGGLDVTLTPVGANPDA